jgi:stress-induced morphogen
VSVPVNRASNNRHAHACRSPQPWSIERGAAIHGTPDEVLERVCAAVRQYTDAHPDAEALVSRYSPVSVRVRVVDPGFRGKSRSERHKLVWPLLYQLDEETLAEVTLLLLLTPNERATSAADRDFTDTFASEMNLSLPEALRRMPTSDGVPRT